MNISMFGFVGNICFVESSRFQPRSHSLSLGDNVKHVGLANRRPIDQTGRGRGPGQMAPAERPPPTTSSLIRIFTLGRICVLCAGLRVS